MPDRNANTSFPSSRLNQGSTSQALLRSKYVPRERKLLNDASSQLLKEREVASIYGLALTDLQTLDPKGTISSAQ